MLRSVLAGAYAAMCAGLVEAVLLLRSSLGPTGIVAPVLFSFSGSTLAIPLGALLGCAFAGVLTAWTPRYWRATLLSIEARQILSVGLMIPLILAVFFRLFLFFAGGFRNLSLAALGASFACSMFMGLAALMIHWLAGVIRRIERRYPVLTQPAVAFTFVAGAWVGFALPGLVAGPDQALRGGFGFFGLLRKDTLNWTPVLTGLCLVGAFVLAYTRRAITYHRFAAEGAVVVALLGLGTLAGASDHVRPFILEQTTLPRVTLAALQDLGDRDHDGASRWLGGGDCDDRNPNRHPGAHEIPGNGIDEDCDGEDLPLETAVTVEPLSFSRPELPNNLSFLIITVDALRPDLGFAGYSRDVSPHIDALAKRATVYDRAYSTSTYTGYCLPPLMASRYPSEMPRTNQHEVHYSPANVFLAERLRDTGFRTAGAASHFLFAPELHWIDGFDQFAKAPLQGNAPPGSHVDLFHSSATLTDTMIQFLQNPRVTSGRFFLWVHFLDPHKQYLEHPGFPSFGHTPRDLYDGEVAFTDYHIGRLLDALRDAKLADRTAIVLTGDHGEAFGEHGVRFHGGEVWDEIVRVPLLVYVPGMLARRVSRRVSHMDIAPTILDLAGAPADAGARGHSLLPEVAGFALPERPILIDQPRNPFYRNKRAFIDGGYKLHDLSDANTIRLFDLENDPGETNDLSESDPDRLKKIRRAYAAFTSNILEIDPVKPGEFSAGLE